MTVFVFDNAKPGLRGELNRWFLELKPGVFVGNVNARIRELLWERIQKGTMADGAVMVYPAANEQGYEMCLFGQPHREVVDLEGIQLIRVVNEKNRNDITRDDFFIEID